MKPYKYRTIGVRSRGLKGVVAMSGRSERVGKRIVAAVVAVAAAVGLGLSVRHDARFTANVASAKYIASANAMMRQEECVYDAIRLKVPKGATVYTTAPRFPPTQRLAELSTLWAVPVANIADAQYRLTLVPPKGRSIVPFPLTKAAPDPAKGQCDGLTLEVRRL
jgi:hypothetical protein